MLAACRHTGARISMPFFALGCDELQLNATKSYLDLGGSTCGGRRTLALHGRRGVALAAAASRGDDDTQLTS